MGELQRTRTLTLAIIGHVFVFGVLIAGAVFLDHLLIEEGDPTLYGYIPWRYIVDTGDLGLSLSFIVYGTLSFIAVLKGPSE